MQPCNEIYDFQIKTLKTTSLYFLFLSFLFIFNFFNLYISKDPFKGASINQESQFRIVPAGTTGICYTGTKTR